MIVIVITVIAVLFAVLGIIVLIFVPDDDTTPDVSDHPTVWIEKNGSYLEIYESNLDPFLKAGWTIWGGEEG